MVETPLRITSSATSTTSASRAAAGEHAHLRAVVQHQHARALAAVGAALHAHDGGDGGALAPLGGGVQGVQQGAGLGGVHAAFPAGAGAFPARHALNSGSSASTAQM